LGEKPTTAFALSLIGGILQLLLGIVIAAGWAVLISRGMIDTIFGAFWIVLSLITIIGAVMMYNKPSSARTWGIIIVVLSIISGLNILTLIGGIMAMRWKPTGAPPPPPPPPP
jgi:hypothetical protein